ncbi:MAG: ABC transporter permease, partial [Bacteroidetes bacterium]|nr:ABC transporter permease [Bacteroidota bacterium]
DLYEMFAEITEEQSLKVARRKFLFASFSYLRPYFLSNRTFSFHLYAYINMLQSTLKITLRLMKRKPVYSFINITGLALGMSAALMIFYFISDELKYDQFHEKKDRIYLIGTDNYLPGSETPPSARSSRLIAPELRENYPEVEHVVRMFNQWTPQVKHNNQRFQDEIFYTESSFFDVFSFQLIAGNPKNALDEPYAVVLTEKAAHKYFGEESPLGKTMIFDDTTAFKVTGIVANPPRHSHFTFDMLLSYSTWDIEYPPKTYDWANYWIYNYLTLKPGITKAQFEPKITNLVEEQYGEKMKSFGLEVELYLEPLTDIYLHSDRSGLFITGDIKYIYSFSFIAVFLILIACFNFINLSTARSLDRAKEVGIKKVVGSQRTHLIWQFLIESLLIAIFSIILALGIAYATIPLFESISGKEVILSAFFTLPNILGLIAITLTIGLLAGAYPAWVLSAFKPVQVLKGKFSHSRGGQFFRRGLIITQFIISITLIISTLVVFGQLSFMQNKNLGFDKEQVLVIDTRNPASEGLGKKYENIKNELLQHGSIEHVSASGRIPGFGSGGGVMFPEGL